MSNTMYYEQKKNYSKIDDSCSPAFRTGFIDVSRPGEVRG